MSTTYRRLCLLPLLLLGCTQPKESVPVHTGSPDTVPEPPPLIVVVMADDLGQDQMWAMETVASALAPESVAFQRAYTTVPLCCPARAGFLLGGYDTSATGVYGNDGASGGIDAFPDDAETIATQMQREGWATALLGKYLNGYEAYIPTIPRGWDLFVSMSDIGDSTDSTLVRGASTPDATSTGELIDTAGEHLTGWLFDEALNFIDAHDDQPMFVLLTPQSPHPYGTPAAEDLGTWADYEARPAAFAEDNVSDKPEWVQETEVTPADVVAWDAETQRMMENLASLDRAAGALVEGLRARGLDERTTLVFTSDNGYLHGQHRLTGKGVPYEEAVRVPLLIRRPGLPPREDDRLVSANQDLAATLMAWAGLEPAGLGQNLSAALADPELETRDHVFLETAFGDHPVWAGVVTETWKYVEWGSGETELYNLANDPNELASVGAVPPADADVSKLSAWTDARRALNVTTRLLPDACAGEAYEASLGSWGGVAPVTWTIDEGALPDGLGLSSDGVISGTPTTTGLATFSVRVTDSGKSPITGGPQSYVSPLELWVGGEAARAKRAGESALFEVPGRPGDLVEIRLHLDDTRDTPPLRRASAEVGPDGLASLRLDGLGASRLWWTYRVNGAPGPVRALR